MSFQVVGRSRTVISLFRAYSLFKPQPYLLPSLYQFFTLYSTLLHNPTSSLNSLKENNEKISEETEFPGNYNSLLYFSEFRINIILIPKKKYIIQLINNIPKLKINSNILYTRNRNATIL